MMEWRTSLVSSRLDDESSGILNKRLVGFENRSIFFYCQIFTSKQNNINI